MTASLKRAVGLWVASKASGLNVYADDLANSQYRYPACVVTEVGHSVVPVGCGKRDFPVRNPSTDFVVSSVRLHREETSFRLTFTAPNGPQRTGVETVDSLAETVERAILATQSALGQTILTDTQTTPNQTYPLETMRIEGRQAVPPDTSGEPFLFRQALTVRLVRLVSVERAVDQVIEHIHIEENDDE